jgi:regulator of sigma E protease
MQLGEIFSAIFSTEGFLVGTLLPFLIVLTVVVFVHEMGHFIAGRLCGIGVDAFSVGFGPEIVGFTASNGTRWKLSAIPLGGYVKFKGEMTITGSLDENDDIAAESIADESKGNGSFHKQAVWRRAITVFAGPLANFLLTVVVFTGIFAVYGQYVADPMVAEVMPGGAADKAGIRPGDRFVSIDGEKITTFSDVQRYISQSAGDPLTIVVDRGGEDISLEVTPDLRETTDPLGNKVKIGLIGVRTDESVNNGHVVQYGPVESVGVALAQTWSALERTGNFMSRLVVGREDKCQLGGPVKIADMAGRAAQKGTIWVVQLVALLSVGIGILNLLPIPPLDGGHLLFYTIESVTRRPVPASVVEILYRIGLVLVLGFMAFVFWNDLFGC